ncbi:unnamed protein product [Chrysoparadoxa australica]
MLGWSTTAKRGLPQLISSRWGALPRLMSAQPKQSHPEDGADSSEVPVVVPQPDHGHTLPPRREKHKIPKKRATSLMTDLMAEARAELKERCAARKFPEIRPGDAIEVEMLPYMSSTRPQIARGVVLAMPRKGLDSTFLIRDVINGLVVERRIPLYSPLLQSIRVVYPAWIHKGKRKGKRVRRNKLYYLRDKDEALCNVSGYVSSTRAKERRR